MGDEQPALNRNRTSDCSCNQTKKQHAETREGCLGCRGGAGVGGVFRGLNGLVTGLRQFGLGIVELLSGIVVADLSLRSDDVDDPLFGRGGAIAERIMK